MPPTRCAAGAELDGAALVAELDAQNLLGLADPADPVKKIHMPRAAAELAIGDALEPDLLLHPHDIADRRILDPPQLRGRNPPRLMLPPRPQQLRRPQQTPDMIGAKRWRIRIGHDGLLLLQYPVSVMAGPDLARPGHP